MRWAIIGFGVVLLVAGVIFFGFAANYTARQMNAVVEADLPAVTPDTVRFHDRLVIADLHADPLLWPRNLARRGGYGHVDVPRLVEGNVAMQVFTTVTKSPRGLNIETNEATSDNITLLAIGQLWPVRTWFSLTERALYQAEKLHRFASTSDGLTVLRTAKDLDRLLGERAGGSREVGGILGLEGAHALEGRLANLDLLFDAGHRVIGLVHFFDNEVGGSRHGTGQGGLTPFGRDVVRRAEELGMVIDLAHASPALTADVLAMTTRPPIVSHTGVRATCDNPRNLSDAELDAVAGAGGLVGIGYWEMAVCDISPAGIARAIAHVRDRVGIGHVALGSDYDGAVHVAFDTGQLAMLTQALRDHGFDDNDIARVMGGNVTDYFLKYLPAGTSGTP
ncbi:MAG: membrane dipeptidase [Sphingomonadales bacterium]